MQKTDVAKSRDSLVWSAGLTFCLLLAALISSVALLMYAVHSINGNQVAYETQLVQRNIDRALGRLTMDMTSAVARDEAYERPRGKVDPAWIERGWSVYLHRDFNHDLTVAIAPDGQPFYAAHEGEDAPAATYKGFVDAAGPLVAQAKAEQHGRSDAQSGHDRDPPANAGAIGIVPWNGGLYLTGVIDAGRGAGDRLLDGRPHVMLVSAKEITPAFLQSLQDSLGLRSLTLDGQQTARTQALVLQDLQGRAAGRLVWAPGDAGGGVLWRFSALIVASLIVLGAASAALMMRVKSMVNRLLAKDAALSQALEELTAARDAAETANQAKSAFIANISHEIRTPLNGLIGMTQVMMANRLDPSQEVRLKVVADSAMTLLALLNDVLDMAKIEAGRLDIVLAPVNLTALIDSACQPFAAMAAAKGLTFEVDVDPQLAQPRLCDALRVRQILVNLASNAVKFTEVGGIRVSAKPTADGVRIEYRDSGVGMAPERLPELFSKFSQIDPSDTRRSTGAGLGLALSQELTQRMGGMLEVQSTLGDGSIFTLTLPAAPAPALPDGLKEIAANLQAAPAKRPKGLRVLAAEDHAVNRMVLESLLEPRGVALTLVSDGAQAVEAYRNAEFDVVLMDIQMPVMSGVEATAAIRAIEADNGRRRTPVLAVTANVLAHQREAYDRVGIDGCVAKPIGAARLHQAIDDALAAVSETSDTNTAAQEDPSRRAVRSNRSI